MPFLLLYKLGTEKLYPSHHYISLARALMCMRQQPNLRFLLLLPFLASITYAVVLPLPLSSSLSFADGVYSATALLAVAICSSSEFLSLKFLPYSLQSFQLARRNSVVHLIEVFHKHLIATYHFW